MLPFESIHFRRLDENTLSTIFEHRLSSEHLGFALVFEQNEHRAILSTLVLRPIEQTGLLELTSLFTRPEVRRQGLARQLIFDTVAYVQQNLPKYLYIFVQSVTPYLFERSGFSRGQLLPKPTFFPYLSKLNAPYQLKTLTLSLAPVFEHVTPVPKSEKEDVEIFLGFDERNREIWRLGFRLAYSADSRWVLVDYGQSPRRYQEWLPVDHFRFRERQRKLGASFSTKPSITSAFRKRQLEAIQDTSDEPPAKLARLPDPLPGILVSAEEAKVEARFAYLKDNEERNQAYSLLVDSLSCVGEVHLELCLFNDAEWRFEVAGLIVDQEVEDEARPLEGSATGEAQDVPTGCGSVPVGLPKKTILGTVVVFRQHRQFNFIELAFFATRKEFRKSGLGQRLFQELESEWKKEAFEYILTFADFAAIPFFRKLNFSEEPVLPKVLYSSWIDRYNMAELMIKRLWVPAKVEDVMIVKPPLAVTVLVGKVNMPRSSKIIRRGWAIAETEDLVCIEYEVWPRKHLEWLKKDSSRWRLDKASRNPEKNPIPGNVTAEALMELHPVIMEAKKPKSAIFAKPEVKTEEAQSCSNQAPEFGWLDETEEKKIFGDEQESVEVRIDAENSIAWLTPRVAKGDDFTQILEALMEVLRDDQEVSFAAVVVENEEQLPLLEELGLSCKLPEDFPSDSREASIVVADLRVD